MVDEASGALDGRFNEIYQAEGRKSIPPERLVRALLLQLLYSVRSERMLMEQLQYNLLFRWFVGLSADEPVWHPTVFAKNRDRLLEGAVAEEFFTLVLEQARRKRLLSSEHFTVDGTLIEAWAGQKSFQPKPGWDDHLKPPPADPGSNPTIDFRKQKRSNETHQSLTDRFARLFKKTAVQRPYGRGGTGRRAGDAAGKAGTKRITLGADRGYDTAGLSSNGVQYK